MDTAEQLKTKNDQTNFMDAAGQLIAYLKEAHHPEDATTIFAIAAYISKMDEQMDLAMKQIIELQEQMRQVQDDQSKESKELSEDLSEITEALRVQQNDVRSEVADIKLTFQIQTNRVLECIKAGVVALNEGAENFKMETQLQKLEGKIESMLSGTEQVIERINTFNMQDAKRRAEALKKTLKETLSCVKRVLEKCTQLSIAAWEKTEKMADKTEITRKIKSR